MPKIKCLLTDDHTLFRQGVRRLLETESSDFEVVGEAADAGQAVEKARELRPDVVLMDIGMQGLSSFEAARQIRKNRPETKVLFLTMYEDEDYLVQCLEVGAAGYVLKDTPAPQLVTAIRDVYKGGKYLSTQVLISDAVRQQLGDGFVTRQLGEFRVAGKKQSVVIHELLCRCDAESGEKSWIEIFEKGLGVFRDGEFEAARDYMERARKMRGGADGPSEFYLRKMTQLEPNGHLEDWTGIVELSEK